MPKGAEMKLLTKIGLTATVGALLAGAITAPAFAADGTGAPTRPTLVPRPAVTATTTPGASGPGAATTCRPFTAERQIAHADVAKRLTTLDQLVGFIDGAGDPYTVNAAQSATLTGAKSGLGALDQKIQTSCYTDRATLSADTRTIFTGYRVYWLRVPQTRILESADHLGAARQVLGTTATKLAGLVGDNDKAKTDLAAMNTDLATADAHVGNPPSLGGSIAAVPALAPAVDMTADVTALKAARTDLEAARKALDAARRDAVRVVADLGGAAAGA
jgi:hypothetical protein